MFCALVVPRALKVPCRPPEVPPTSGRLMTRPGTFASSRPQMSRPPGVPWISCSLRLTATFALVVSTVGDAPVTVMFSARLATFIANSTGVVWPTRTTMFSRVTV